MPSSTSSSRALWPRSWILALLLVSICLGSWEWFWRSHDFEPSLNDDAALWALSRQRASALGSDAVVLVGSSRMQMDLHRETFAEATGWPPAMQLATARGASLPVLQNLSEDSSFRGRVVCEVNPLLFFANTPHIDRVLEDYIRVFEEMTPADEFEQWLRMQVQARLVTRLPSLAPGRLGQAWKRGSLPWPGFNSVIGADRYRYGDFSKFRYLEQFNRKNRRQRESSVPRALDPAAFEEQLRAVDQMVERIEKRGGRVFFVRLPSSLHVLANEERWFRREQWWDVFAAQTRAPAIHFRDHPRLAGFEPPDGDHLGRADAIRFSRALGEILAGLAK